MKKYILPTTLTVSTLLLASCGSKDTEAQTSADTTTQESVQATGGHAEVKKALKGQVNSTTSDLMLKVANYIDLPPAHYDIPSSLEGRDLVQVTVKWPMVAKHDLYLSDSHLLDHPDKPVVVEKIHSKGDQVEYVECNYVLEADGGGGYIAKNSQFTKQRFQFSPGLDKKENLGKLVLVKGSDEHMAAVKIAAGVKQEREEQERIAKAEAEAKEAAAVQAKIDQLLKVLQKKGAFSGVIGDPNKSDRYGIELKVLSVSEVAGEAEVVISIANVINGKKYNPATFSAIFNDAGKIVFQRLTVGKGTHDSPGFISGSSRTSTTELSWASHIDKINLEMKDSNSNSYVGTLIRR